MRRLTLVFISLAAFGAGGTLTGTASAAPAGSTHYPDLQTIIPLNSFSVVQGTEGREFRYTHLVYNNGPGPLEIQPHYNPVSGTYQGMQLLYTHNSAGVWSLVSEVRVPDAFEYHAAHGHFHFPLASFGLYQVTSGGGIGAPVSISPKNGFCIDDSYIYNTSVEHSGAFVGFKGSCSEPTRLRGLSVGGADEYDYRDPGQSIPFAGLPDGQYWFRAMTDPHNDLVEADESNNETDVLVTVSASKVTTGTVLHPDTTPPAVTMTAPAQGAFASGAVGLTASSPVTGVGALEFVVDGVPVGTSSDTASPYHLTWDSSTVPDGEHWVAARATDAQGRTNTSAVVALNISNTGPPPLEPGSFGIDAAASADGQGTLSKSVQIPHGGDYLLCLIASDGPSGAQTATVSGGGLSWSLVRRANGRPGTSEAWKASGPANPGSVTVTSTQASGGFDQSMTVLAFGGSDGIGASSASSGATGAPTTTVTTTDEGSWVFGVGNDPDRAIARTVGAGQSIRHEWIDTPGAATFWMQSQSPSASPIGTIVPISDTAPTNDQWNLVGVEVMSSTGSPPPPPPQDTTPPQVSISDPDPGETVSGITALGAIAADNVGVTTVQFKVDGTPLGGPVNAPPFMAQWDTRIFSSGQHTVTAEAFDAAGNVGVSSAVSVNVDNSGPTPAIIEIDAKQVLHGTGTLTSPAIKTSAPGDVLVAYAGLDGPNSPGSQTATVTGAGLTWTLVKRSNTQAGDAEIWSAKATSQLSNATVVATPGKSGFSGSLVVIAYKNAAGVGIAGGSGAPSGTPDIYLPGIGMGSWVFAVGNDWDRAVARTPVAGQVLQDQWIASGVGDTYWVQSTAAPNLAPGLVTIHDDAPTNDRWNYAAVEVLPALTGAPPPPPPVPSAPSLTGTLPASPANQNSPKILGSAEAGSTVRLYTSAGCSGVALATVAASALPAGVEVSVGDDSTTSFRATATTAGGTSSCSAPTTYVEDSTAPQTQIGTHPPALSESASASFEFTGEDPGGSGLASFECRLDSTAAAAWASCASPKPYTTLANGSHLFEVRARDRAGNTDASPASFQWQVNVPPPVPSAPSLTGTLPASPANQNSPKILGSAEAGSTVRLYTSAGCSGVALATVAASALPAGVEVSVGDDSTTSFRATATTAGGTSSCSAPTTYVEDSTAPQTQIGTHPPALSESASASFEFTGEDPGGSGLASFECRLDSTAAAAWASCASPKPYTTLANGSHLFEVRARDRAGNTDASPASFQWQVNVPSPTLALDKVVTTHQTTAGSTIAAPALTTSKPGELLLAMIASDGPSAGGQTISGVSGGGLTWTLRKRANAQAGTAEIWQAAAPAALTNTVITATRGKTGYQGAITIAAFSGADTGQSGAVGSGAAASGAPSASLLTTRAGAWVWAVGNDWDKAVARTLGPGQTLVDQFLASSGDTFWAQRRTEPTPLAGTTVTINDTAPTTDRWNLALAEVLPAPGP